MIPENELGVIILFAEATQDVGFEILAIQSAYPDAVVLRDGIEYRVEFEFIASNFVNHGHNPSKCDLIVCWENDDEENPMPILELSDPDWKMKKWAKPTSSDRNAAYWRHRALKAEKEMNVLKNGNTTKLDKSTQKRDQILLLAKVPGISQAEIARIIEASPSYVSEVIRSEAVEEVTTNDA